MYIVNMIDKGEDFDVNEQFAFETEEDAIKKFRELIAEFESCVDLDDFVVEAVDDFSYLAYKDGYYDRNHFTVEIIKKEI